MRPTLLDHFADSVKEAYMRGATLKEIADVYNCSPGTVRICLKKNDVPLRRPGRRRKENK